MHDPGERFLIGFAVLLAFQIFLWTTVLYFVRRWNKLEPAWSWLRMLGRVIVLTLLVSVVQVIPMVGNFAALVASLIGVKRLTGVDVLPAFLLSFCIGVSVYVATVIISHTLHVELLALPN